MFNSYPPLYPYSDFNFKEIKNLNNIMFFASARDALFLIIQTLKESYKNLIFLIPAYTCHSVIESLERAKVNYNFIDLDESLDFNLNDLNYMLNKYFNKKVILIPTSLFGIRIRDYKKLYNDIIIIEDLAQSTFNYKSKAEFQFVSFGRGKLISAWNGGGVISNNLLFRKKYNQLNRNIKDNFLKSYFLSNIQKIISKYFWFFIENSFLNPENVNIKKIEIELKINDNKILKLSNKKINWILHSIKNVNLKHRKELSNYYLNKISTKYLFNLNRNNNTIYLRFPVKKIIKKSGVSFMKDYRFTYEKAKELRDRELKIAKQLAYETSFLPTHNLITLNYVKKLVDLLNE